MTDQLIPPNRNDFITEKGDMTQRTARFFELLANNTNTNTTTIEEAAIDMQGAVTSDVQGTSEDEAFYYFSPKTLKAWNAVIATQAYYAAENDYIEARTNVIYLPQYPAENAEVIVASDYSSNVIVLGNGNTIKVKSENNNITISQKGTSLHFIYFIDGGYWRII